MNDIERVAIEGLKTAVERLEKRLDPDRIAREVAKDLKELEPPKLINVLEPVTKPIPPGWDPTRKNVILAQPPTDYVPPEKRTPPPKPERPLTADEVLERQGGWEPVLLKLGWRMAFVAETSYVVWLEPQKEGFNGRLYFETAAEAARACDIPNPFQMTAIGKRCRRCGHAAPPEEAWVRKACSDQRGHEDIPVDMFNRFLEPPK